MRVACRCRHLRRWERSIAVKVRAQDAEGHSRVIEARACWPCCIQHEMDHLMGRCSWNTFRRSNATGSKATAEIATESAEGMTAMRVVFAGTPAFARVALSALIAAGFETHWC